MGAGQIVRKQDNLHRRHVAYFLSGNLAKCRYKPQIQHMTAAPRRVPACIPRGLPLPDDPATHTGLDWKR